MYPDLFLNAISKEDEMRKRYCNKRQFDCQKTLSSQFWQKREFNFTASTARHRLKVLKPAIINMDKLLGSNSTLSHQFINIQGLRGGY